MRTRADRRSIAEDLVALRDAFQGAVVRSDLAAMAAAYTEDARLILPSGVVIDGRTAIEQYWRTGFETGASSIGFVSEGIEIGDRVAWEFGTYGLATTPPNEPPAKEIGRYLTVHCRGDDGRWRRAVDVLDPTGLMVTTGTPTGSSTVNES